MRLLETVVAGRVVVIRTDGLRHTPVCNRQVRVEFGGALKRASGLVVIESVDQSESLIEKLLRFRIVGRYGMMQVPDPLHQRHWLACLMVYVLLSYTPTRN